MRWPSVAPGQARLNRGEGSLDHIVVRVDHRQRTWKEDIPGFMAQGGCPSLCSGVNSCTQSQGLITRVSLEIPATETPGGRGPGGGGNEPNLHHASSANHRPQQHFYWEEFISQVYQRCPPVYFPACWNCKHLIKAGEGELLLPTRCCLQRCEGDSFHEFPWKCILFPSIITCSPPPSPTPYFLVYTIYCMI